MSRARRLIVALVAIAALLATARTSRADDGKGDLAWNPSWPTFRPLEYVLTGAAGAASAGAFLVMRGPSEARWTGGILFDDGVRDALRLRSPGARDAVRTASDVTALASVVVIGVDSIIVPLARKRGDVALQLTLMDAESFAFSTLLTTTMFNTIGRARPSYEDCKRNPGFDPLCNGGRTSSFPSGHTNAAFTAAGLSCAHHANLALYGSPVADAMACAGMVTLATATATFRVMGDRHYASDVLVGGLIGFGFGLGTPTLLHYGAHDRAGSSALSVTPMTGMPGVLVSGSF